MPAKVINDAAMQALGSYRGGRMLFLGLGTGLGTAMIFNGIVEPMELGHLPYRKATFEDYVGRRGLERLGKKKWRLHVAEVIELLRAALLPDDIVIGGGNAERFVDLPHGCRRGDNANAFAGGFRLWAKRPRRQALTAQRRSRRRDETAPVRLHARRLAGAGGARAGARGSSRCASSSPPIPRAASA